MIGAVESLRSTVEGAFHAAVCHVDAESATHRYASQRWGGSTSPQGLLVLALGKAAPAMTRGLVAAMPAVPRRGVVVAAQPAPIPDGMELLIGSHPVPTEASLVAGERLLAVAASARPEETVVVLVSGGGSALAEALRPGISLDDLRRATETLLRSGAAIDEVNTVRQRVSRLKGGGLSAALPGAPPLTIAVSDVVGDPPSVIASGPTVAPIDDGAMARLHAVGVVARLPAGVAAALTGGTAESIPAAGEYVVVGNGPLAAEGARRHLEAHGVAAAVADEPLQGEARHTALAVWDRFEHSGHAALVFHGETTVTVGGAGTGGRNQEAALAAALALVGARDRVFLAAGTDGIDGPTTAAGAIVDGATVARGRRAGLDPIACLGDNDSHRFLDAAGALLTTGPTGTNVGDVWIAAADPHRRTAPRGSN